MHDGFTARMDVHMSVAQGTLSARTPRVLLRPVIAMPMCSRELIFGPMPDDHTGATADGAEDGQEARGGAGPGLHAAAAHGYADCRYCHAAASLEG